MKTFAWLISLALLGACVGEGASAGAGTNLQVRIDSIRHVACYKVWSIDGISCVVLDSLNRHAIAVR